MIKILLKIKKPLQDILTSVNLQIKSEMHLPYFKQAYEKFLSHILQLGKQFSPAELKNPQKTANELINKHWKKHLEKAKKEWEKIHEKEKDKIKEHNKKRKADKRQDQSEGKPIKKKKQSKILLNY